MNYDKYVDYFLGLDRIGDAEQIKLIQKSPKEKQDLIRALQNPLIIKKFGKFICSIIMCKFFIFTYYIIFSFINRR